MDRPIYKRVLLKLSGEALQRQPENGIDSQQLIEICHEIGSIVKLGVQVALVIGGGNIIRGAELNATPIDRITADQMGMLATIINGLALRDALQKQTMSAEVMSAISVSGLAAIYDRAIATRQLNAGNVLIFVAGTGNPLVTTDSAAALRGIEIGADIVLKATKVDGVFAADPIKNPKAVRYETLSYDEVLEQRLGVMDLNAILLCQAHRLPLRVFNMNNPGALERIVKGEEVGTLIQSGE